MKTFCLRPERGSRRAHRSARTTVLLGSGEHLLAGIDAPTLGYQCTKHVPMTNATHIILSKHG